MRNNPKAPGSFNGSAGSGNDPHAQSHAQAQQIVNRIDKPSLPRTSGSKGIDTSWSGQNFGNYGSGPGSAAGITRPGNGASWKAPAGAARGNSGVNHPSGGY